MRLNTNSLKRTVAVLAAVCTLGTCCIAGSIAYAQGEAKGVDTANINQGKKSATSIIIHKYQGPATGERSDGTVKTLRDKKPVKGVKFTLWRVKKKNTNSSDEIDLSKSSDWEKIKGLDNLVETATNGKKTASDFINGAQAEFAKADTNGTEKETDDKGEAKFENLAMGLYYIEETDTSGAQLQEDGTWKKVSITKRVSPFFVTTPLPNPKDKANPWIYAVNVYPKNDTSKERPTKTVSELNRKDLTTNNGTTITWKIAIPLTAPKNGNKYEKIGFKDKLENGLTYDKISSAKLVTYSKDGQKLSTPDEVPLTEDDYTATNDSNTKVVSFSLKNDAGKGLNKAYTAYTAATDGKVVKLEVELVTKVADTVKDIANVANTYVDDNKTGNGDGNDPCTPTKKDGDCGGDDIPNDTAHFGTLTVNKVTEEIGANGDKKKLPLNDAKFDVYEVTDTSATANDTFTVSDGKIKKNNQDAGTKLNNVSLKTKEKTDGGAKTEGTDSVRLFVYNSKETNPAVTTKLYCVVETEAPAGYLLDSTPKCVALKADTAADATKNNTKEIENKKATGLDKILAALPMTGARGLVLLTAFGIVGLGGTLFYIITRRRKEREEA
ncbi:SpaH/EbpB family LPXTG-anchored major pilin [Gardnerella vaginalis]|uniref:SpaH/EbpB family LPXTG-anchored major pilin n=1 Tax=Gardnerella vaginalis TaxID=2702 RepID=UPI0025516D58|nr:SpaH/EbpB family LPXTG-anchored major pilin [Gardnerella vaginalis]MDK7260309.1 SpaH/EbpB family LPXTG-anchored major pilin [Gardnerella vaginalis]MDK8777112.1 SpaH/EbpB family LPXTG-anchored major pilin [Gardnerella vaginalis]